MAIIKKRPALRLYMDPIATPGEPLTGELVVKADEPVPIDWLKVTFHGEEFAGMGSGKQRTTKKLQLYAVEQVLLDARELDVGTHRLAFTLPVRDGLPPTYNTSDARSTYTLSARASIPWWPDAKARWEIKMRSPAPAAEHPGAPMIVATNTAGPQGTEPYAEVSLATRVFAAGDVIRGAVALSNVGHNKYRRVLLELHRHQRVFWGRRHAQSRSRELRYTIDVADVAENEQRSFNIQLPETLSPSHVSQMWSVAWFMRVRIDVPWAVDPKFDFDVPVVGARFKKDARAIAAPAVGAVRLEACWQEVADDLELELIGNALRIARGGTVLEVWRQHTEGGARLHAKISYPSLGLGIECVPSAGFFSGAGRSGVQIGESGWDKRHKISARDEDQCGTFLSGLAPSLIRLTSVTMSDTELATSIAGTGSRRDSLSQFVRPLLDLAQLVEQQRKSIGPPAAVASLLPRWRDLARQLDGDVHPGDLSIDGYFHGRPVRVAAAWTADGEPAEIAVELDLKNRVAKALECRVVPALLMEALPESLPGPARELIESLAGVASRIEIEGDTLRAASEWLADPRHAIGVLRTLAEIADVLEPRGPFR